MNKLNIFILISYLLLAKQFYAQKKVLHASQIGKSDFENLILKSQVIKQDSFPQTHQNTTKFTNIKFCKIDSLIFGENFNIALIDIDKNKIINEKDHVSISKNDIFIINQNQLSSNIISEVKTIRGKHFFYEFSLNDSINWTFNLEKINEIQVKNADLSLEDKLINFKIQNDHIYDKIPKNEYCILDLFSEYCSVCIKTIPKLNTLNSQVKIIGLIETSQKLTSFIMMHNISYESYLLTPEIKKCFNLNGSPNYILIGKDKTILHQSYSIEEVIEFMSEI